MSVHNRATNLPDLVDVMVSATEPTVRDNGDALQDDDLWRDTSSSPQTWNVWDGSDWQPMGGGGASGHDHASDPVATIVMESPDGSLFDVTIDNTGTLTTTGFDALLAEDGDLLTTEAGDILALES